MSSRCAFVVLAVLIAMPFLHAQKTPLVASSDAYVVRCNTTVQQHEHRMQVDPQYRKWQTYYRTALQKRFFKNPNCVSGPVRIPVAVHFDAGVVPAAQEACMINLVLDQVTMLNVEINGNDPQNSAFAPLASCFGGSPVVIGNACLEFCLATYNHPTGYGLSEGDYAVTFGQINFSNTAPGSGVPIDNNWSGYLNIFVDDLGGGLLGEASAIGGSFVGDGVIVNACNFGTGNLNCPGVDNSASCGGIYNEGNTLGHEVGHYLGLRHIWGDGGCAASDFIADTPSMNSSYSGLTNCNDNNCGDLPTSCGSADMYMNYMSYAADGCMYMFTSDQADVMYNTALINGFTINIPAQCVPPAPPVAAIGLPSGTICPGECLVFTDQSTNTPSSWLWTFSVTSGDITIDITSSTDRNPTVCITGGTSGTIEAVLEATNVSGTNTSSPSSVSVTVLAPTHPQCDVACTQATGGPFVDFSFPNMCEAGCPTVTVGFSVWENEGYIVSLAAGISYTFEFCTGYNPAVWEAIITVGQHDGSGGITPGTVLTAVSGCTATFMPSTTGEHLIIISGDNNCGGAHNQTNNGAPTLTCNAPPACASCGTTFSDKNNTSNGNYANNENTVYTFCPDNAGDMVEVTFSAFDIEPDGPNDCYDYLEVFNGPSTASPQLGGEYCGTTPADAPGGGSIASTDISGCLTFEFTTDVFVTETGWLATVQCVAAPVPVELVYFQANGRSDHIALRWETASEIQNAGFKIWRSANGLDNYEEIGWVDGRGDSNDKISYSYDDRTAKANRLYYYRLQQMDLDGRSEYSNISSAMWTRDGRAVAVFPNPVDRNVLTVRSTDIDLEGVVVRLIDTDGRVVFDQTWDSDVDQHTLDVSDIASGVYVLVLTNAHGMVVHQERIVKLD